MPLYWQVQPKARGQGSLGDAGHKHQPSGAKIREEKGREENLLVMIGSANSTLHIEAKAKTRYAEWANMPELSFIQSAPK